MHVQSGREDAWAFDSLRGSAGNLFRSVAACAQRHSCCCPSSVRGTSGCRRFYMHPSCNSGEKQPALLHCIGRLVAGLPGTIQRPQRLPLDMETSHRKMQMSGLLANYLVKIRKAPMSSTLLHETQAICICGHDSEPALFCKGPTVTRVHVHLGQVSCAMPLRGVC